MTKKVSWMLFFIGLVTAAVPAAFQEAPGYADADYYYATALRIVEGQGMTDAFLWHYLGDFSALVHPSHSFWMPLTTWLAAAGMAAVRTPTFWGAKIPFLLLAAVVPVLTARMTWKLTKDPFSSRTAGWLACFAGFYLPFLPVTDSFSPLMLLGAVYFLLFMEPKPGRYSFWVGLTCGAMHLARAEGLIWLALAGAALIFQQEDRFKSLLLLTAGYLILVGPWMIRNYLVFGQLLGKGGLKTLWLTEYNQLFAYPADQINYQAWRAQGWWEILRDRWWALQINLQTALVVQGQIYLTPLLIWGIWKYRDRAAVRLGGTGWLGLMAAMTLVFPFPGARGSFFHGGAALQPMFWGLAAAGLAELLKWGKRHRSWHQHQAAAVLGTGLIVISGLLSMYLVSERVIGKDFSEPVWNKPQQRYQMIEVKLLEEGLGEDQPVLVNNPPGYYAVNRRRAAAVPSGGLAPLLEAAGDFGADYILLDENYPPLMKDYYFHPETRSGLIYKGSAAGIRIYQIPGSGP